MGDERRAPPPSWAGSPDTNHAEEGQEEVYVVVEGDAVLHAGGQTWRLERCMLARVGPNQKRKIVPGENGVGARRHAGAGP